MPLAPAASPGYWMSQNVRSLQMLPLDSRDCLSGSDDPQCPSPANSVASEVSELQANPVSVCVWGGGGKLDSVINISK